MNRISVVRSLFCVLALTLLAGCGGYSGASPYTPAPLSAGNINLIFVVSDDLAYNASGDVNPGTANLTNQGLQRSLLMATYQRFMHIHAAGLFQHRADGGVNGAVIPANINTNQKIYIIRHAEAHPDPGSSFEDGIVLSNITSFSVHTSAKMPKYIVLMGSKYIVDSLHL